MTASEEFPHMNRSNSVELKYRILKVMQKLIGDFVLTFNLVKSQDRLGIEELDCSQSRRKKSCNKDALAECEN